MGMSTNCYTGNLSFESTAHNNDFLRIFKKRRPPVLMEHLFPQKFYFQKLSNKGYFINSFTKTSSTSGLGCNPVGTWTKVDMWVVMCLQITGFLYFAFMFGYVASTRSASASALLEHNVSN